MVKKINKTKLESIRHKDKRSNIPTKELRDFLADEELSPKNILYPRDSAFDPQLVWNGKDEQDSQQLAVPAVPLYIHEKIHSQAIINDLPRIEPTTDNQFTLFSDFNGGPHDFDKKIDFYHHEQNWTNRLILGDSLLVMTSLAEKEQLKNKIQTIYMDPPYGIKFSSNWQVSTRKREVKEGKIEDTTRQPEQVRAFRDTWKMGIHSYLAYLRDRLILARDLLTETGSIFLQISDENMHLVRSLMDEVFGFENFCCLIPFRKRQGRTSSSILPEQTHDFIIWYSKNKSTMKYRQLYIDKDMTHLELFYDNSKGEQVSLTPSQKSGKESLPIPLDKIYTRIPLELQSHNPKRMFSLYYQGKEWRAPPKGWAAGQDELEKMIELDRLTPKGKYLLFKRYYNESSKSKITSVWNDTAGEQNAIYVVQTSELPIQRCLLMTTDPGDLVFDPTCGSGTTAFVAEQWGRRWISCDTSRVALALARTRLMSAKFPYYFLSDSSDGCEKEIQIRGKIPQKHIFTNDVKKGFVYKQFPHITLSDVTSHPNIKKGMTKEQINEAIVRHADTIPLYDQPYEDKNRVRVCGPFSVESLSPHRILSTADGGQDITLSEQEAQKQQDFVTMILDNIKTAGIQNSHKNERLNFDRLDPYPGIWLHGCGEFTDNRGKTLRVAVSIGPEHGTVGPQQVKEAAKEAVQGVGFDVLVICGFAFDSHVGEEMRRYGKLKVMRSQMNHDLTMGNELLKKTKTGNLFMVFGEPDIEIRTQKNGNVIVELNGVDVYDPTTGVIRNSSSDDIACWFIDTDYNGESFFVRHAYFTGANQPYDKLKRALKSEIDEDAWSSIYSTVSRPFHVPETGKIAIKVINHYGDEVLKVFEVPVSVNQKCIRTTNAAMSIKKSKDLPKAKKNLRTPKNIKSSKGHSK
jgi:adenine-specific DNA-methyltransferase